MTRLFAACRRRESGHSSAARYRRFITTLAAAAVFGGLAEGQAPTEVLQVAIDVKPGDTPTRIEPKRGGMLPVAILSSPEFDASLVDPATVRFGAAGTRAAVFRSSTEDADSDGDIDLLLLFRMPELKLDCDSGEALFLEGKTRDGRTIEGKESVEMEGCG